MIEYKTERVGISLENDIIQIYSHFGWQYVGSQDVYNSDTYVSGGNISGQNVNIQQSTRSSQYVAVRFQRDTEIPNYSKIKSLNDEFEQLLLIRPDGDGWFLKFVLLSITGILFPIAIIVLILHFKKQKKYENAQRRLRIIINQADELLTNK